MQIAFLDTNILLENIINPRFQARFLELSSEYEIVIHESALLELGNLTKKYFGSRIASKIIRTLIATYRIYPQSLEDIQPALAIMDKYDFNKPNKDYTLTDCLMLHCADKQLTTLISMDFEMSLYQFKQGEFLHIRLSDTQ